VQPEENIHQKNEKTFRSLENYGGGSRYEKKGFIFFKLRKKNLPVSFAPLYNAIF
jgi:hypothetical protein